MIDPRVRLILIVLHHPPVADEQSAKLMDHNPRPNEQAFAEYLSGLAAYTRARIVVSAGRIHNYERFARDGVTYLVSGGGGAALRGGTHARRPVPKPRFPELPLRALRIAPPTRWS